MQTVKNVLKSALHKIEKGWCRNTLRTEINGNTHYCSVGAINASTQDFGLRSDARYTLERVIQKLFGSHYTVVGFNDRSNDKRRVVRAFKEAIRAL